MTASPLRTLAAGTLLSLALLLSSCGGGNPGGPSVLNMGASNVRYGGKMLVSVAGKLLTQGAVLTGRGCDNAAVVAGGTDDSIQFTCTVSATGSVSVSVLNPNGNDLGTLTVDVPKPQVTIITTSGTILVELDPVSAKATVDNFLAYAAANFYANVLVHRVINDKLIQAGGYLTGPKAKIANLPPIALQSNNGLKNLRGTIAMWHLDGQPDSANAQFFINTADNPDFDYQSAANPGYAVFGTVVTGLDVVDAIKVVPTTSKVIDGAASPLADTPVTEIKLTSVTQTK